MYYLCKAVVARRHKNATINEEQKYLILSFPRSGNEAKHGVEFRHSIRNAFRTRRNVRNGVP